jgi:hypothetical protein
MAKGYVILTEAVKDPEGMKGLWPSRRSSDGRG